MKHLTKEQRYVISSLRKAGHTLEYIAKDIGVHKSTVSRELKRNSNSRGRYSPKNAVIYAKERKERYSLKRKFTPVIENRIRRYIEQEQWSPEQILGYCKSNGLEMVSIERIYQYIREDKQQNGSLHTHMRHKLKHRRRPVGAITKVKIKDRVSIDQRPESINKREEFGHWEADLIAGKGNKGFILTLTERVSKHFLIQYLPHGKQAKEVSKAIINCLLPYKESTHSLTMDNGLEFAEHKMVAEKLDIQTYFTNPYSSWEKGQIEYMNKLLRQYYPKGKEINESNTKNINEIQYKINRRPRKNLGYVEPYKLFYKFVEQKVAFRS